MDGGKEGGKRKSEGDREEGMNSGKNGTRSK